MTNYKNNQLLLMRHGKSDWGSGVKSDFDRPLNPRGITDVRKIATWMRVHDLIPDRIVSSPAVRTRDTAMLVMEGLELQPSLLIWENTIYEASLTVLLGVIARHSVDCHCLLLIGHNPGLDSLVTHLASADPGRTESGKLMTTGSLTIFDHADTPISTVQNSGQLRQLLRPRQIV